MLSQEVFEINMNMTYNEGAKDTSSTLGTGTQVASTAILIINFLIGMLQGASLSLLWNFINTIQVIEFMLLLNISPPVMVREVLNRLVTSVTDGIPKTDLYDYLFNTTSAYDPYLEHFSLS